MTASTPTQEQPVRDWPLWAVVPSWVISLVLHTGLLFLIASGFWRSEPKDMHKGDDAGYRSVGIVVKSVESESESTESEQQEATESPIAPQTTFESEAPSLLDKAKIPLSLPKFDTLPTIGAGGAIAPPGLERDVEAFGRPNGALTGAGAPGLGQSTSFYGINDKGTQVVYVLDCSASMEGAPLADAKLRLMQSLQQLNDKQRFAIIFYNERAYPMTLRGSADAGLYWATNINKTLAADYIRSHGASGGTDHFPALKAALKLSPDVIYFLSDAQDGVSAGKRDDIRRTNKGSRIHCIEFGEGPGLRNVPSFLKQLAAENEGTYRYEDVTRLGAK